MKNTGFLLLSAFLLFSILFFSNCRYYGPASTGNSAHYMARPWYNDTTVSSLQVSGRLNKGRSFNEYENNRFNDAEINYARVSKYGHIALGGGAMAGKYKVSYPNHPLLNGDKAYRGTVLRGEFGLRYRSPLALLFQHSEDENLESTMGFGYTWATEKGAYLDFRRSRLDTSAYYVSNQNASQHLHTFSTYSERRMLFKNKDVIGGRLTCGMTLESGLVDNLSDFQYNATIFYTHKLLTLYGQIGGSMGLNLKGAANACYSFGVNARLLEWKDKK